MFSGTGRGVETNRSENGMNGVNRTRFGFSSGGQKLKELAQETPSKYTTVHIQGRARRRPESSRHVLGQGLQPRDGPER